LKQSMLAVPKKKGFTSPNKRGDVVNLKQLESSFDVDSVVTPEEMLKKGLITSVRISVKILGQGKLTKKMTVHAQGASKTALAAIEAAGGSFKIVPLPKRDKQPKADSK